MEFEWKILDFFDQFRNKFFDFFNYFVSDIFGSILLVVIFLLIYWLVDKEKGRAIGFTFITSTLVNNLIKGFVNRKRPFEYENKGYLRKLQNSTLSDGATGTSFPSGHTQNSSALYVSVMLEYPGKRFKGLTVVLAILIFSVAISRLYLGVHFPSDVLVGLVIGIAISFIIVYLHHRLGKKCFYLYILFCIVFLPCLFFERFGRDFIKSYGLLVGFTLGTILEEKTVDFHCRVSFGRKLIRLVIGLVIVGGAYLVYSIVPKEVHYNKYFTLGMHFLIAFLGVYVVPLLFNLLENGASKKKC